MHLLIIGGFLGSGKTSFLLQLARYMTRVRNIRNIVILENEIGEVGVDDKIIQNEGYQVKGMFSGCVCCTMAGELPITIRSIERDLDPEWIIMEATGVAFPNSIRENLQQTLQISAGICCLADARRWLKMVGPMGHLLPFQLKGADIILVSKADLADAETLEAVTASVHKINPEPRIEPVCAIRDIDESILEAVCDVCY